MYRVIKAFVDLQDNNHKYDVGDIYPRKRLNVLQRRINELARNKNKQKMSEILSRKRIDI